MSISGFLSRQFDFFLFSFNTSQIINSSSFGFYNIKHLSLVVENLLFDYMTSYKHIRCLSRHLEFRIFECFRVFYQIAYLDSWISKFLGIGVENLSFLVSMPSNLVFPFLTAISI